MQEVTVTLPTASQRSYKIHVGANILAKLGELYDLAAYSKLVVVTDDAIEPLLLNTLMSALTSDTPSVVLATGEQHKATANVERIWYALHEAGCDRKSLVINFGGGVIGDIGGFAAATYMRGIDFLNIPTSLLSQVDASVGGKTGFNFDGVKNLVGTFDQPIGVMIDVQTLATLPKREFTSGFGEIIKHGVISDSSYFNKVTSKPPQEFSEAELTDIIAESCRIKAAIVQEDETEAGVRKTLNFGHTIGHAVEAAALTTDKPLLHGEAVSIGMAAEAEISHAQAMLSAEELKRLRQVLITAGLPVGVADIKPEAIVQKMQSDKKNEHGTINFTLLEAIGHSSVNHRVSDSVITEAIQAILR